MVNSRQTPEKNIYREKIIITPEILTTIEQISGKEIEDDLVVLAQIGGTRIESNPKLIDRFSVSRLALSKEDAQARIHLKNEMEAAGMTVEMHPLGLVGTYQGTDPEIPSIGMLSHYDSVPQAGMYDGTVGVLSAIHIVKKLNEQAIKPKKSIKVIAVTGEESARFNMALFGSKGMFTGLTDEELDLIDKQGISIRQALIDLGYNPEDVKKSLFSKEDFEAIIEFHVAQDNRYPDKLCVIEAIAAPERYKLNIGEKDLKEIQHLESDKFYTLTIHGNTGHSGATPMGDIHRNDGLVLASEVIQNIISLNQTFEQMRSKHSIIIGKINIPGEAMNKIPGRVDLNLCITGPNPKEAETLLNKILANTKCKEIVELKETKKSGPFYQPKEMNLRLKKAIDVIKSVNTVANSYAQNQCVGTVSTINNQDGQIQLGIDLRGIEHTQRQKMIKQIKQLIYALTKLKFDKPLPGSGKPESMDEELVFLAEQLITQLDIANFIKTFSAAGHDIQNISRALIKTLLIFCPSPNGLAHNPEEYSSPDHLEWGAKTMAALVLSLSN